MKKKNILKFGMFIGILLLISPFAFSQVLCPAVCVENWKVVDDICVYEECGSGCTVVDNINAFESEERCELIYPSGSEEIMESEVEPYEIPASGVGYFIKQTLPEYFLSARHYFNEDDRINWKLKQLERRKIEYEYLLEKLNQTDSEIWAGKYKNMIKIISKRQEQNLKKLDKYSSKASENKRKKVRSILSKRESKLNELKERFSEVDDSALEGIDNAIERGKNLRDRIKGQS